MPSEHSEPAIEKVSATPPKFKFEINLRLVLLGLCFLPLLISLGLWQLDRAEEKATLLSAFNYQQTQQPMLVDSDNAEKILSLAPYTNIKFEGLLDDDVYWLLDNRMQAGKFGYEVLQLAKVGDIRLLINRGWFAGPLDRRLIPEMNLLQGTVNVLGQLVTPTKNSMLDEDYTDQLIPQRIVQIDLESMSRQYGQPIHGMVRLDAQSEGALYINWPTVNISPSKHQGYALQWFSMAAALVILLAFANSNLLLVIKHHTSHNKKL